MLKLLSDAGRSFLRAFGASLLFLSLGVLSVPDLNAAYGLAVAALIASVAAGLKAVQVFVPGFSVGYLLTKLMPQNVAYENIEDSFTRAFVATAIIALPNVLGATDLSTAKSLLTALVIGAATAGVRAVQGLLTAGDVPAPAVGITVK